MRLPDFSGRSWFDFAHHDSPDPSSSWAKSKDVLNILRKSCECKNAVFQGAPERTKFEAVAPVNDFSRELMLNKFSVISPNFHLTDCPRVASIYSIIHQHWQETLFTTDEHRFHGFLPYLFNNP